MTTAAVYIDRQRDFITLMFLCVFYVDYTGTRGDVTSLSTWRLVCCVVFVDRRF